jgi:hypothetical protein
MVKGNIPQHRAMKGSSLELSCDCERSVQHSYTGQPHNNTLIGLLTEFKHWHQMQD